MDVDNLTTSGPVVNEMQNAIERASSQYPSVLIAGHRVHIFETRGEWHVWLDVEDKDFTGLCIAVGQTRQDAVTEAVRVLEDVTAFLQERPRSGRRR